ncbi:MAG TPA: DHH family phosphoesterase [Phycisphaerae bacterium]|jgi:nanoRNase/pAp phosphatase (c-di-AMP/oligoRNAs hydrolase)|nr:hypothetical protein [Phycisphaerae bacterium]HOB74152.1 DHH family phosphoesterase [Phycisphaerae bacterium]HOJ55924.1 DHH family phosphoesterase [Phycisphaerae bacterium]HOL27610.1 DHH family phosphoesterase [Phycisphaerae bacterium]HPP22188.1 DHH family phosphoesterase [Phycisphaerae bacterium]
MDSTGSIVTTTMANDKQAGRPARRRRSDRFLRALSDFDNVVILTHDNPDPDAIAAGWGLYVLIKERLGKPVRLVAGGAILRAENLRMVELLKPPIELLSKLEVSGQCAVVLEDCQASAVNHLLTSSNLRPTAVIDHHQPVGERLRLRFTDIRPQVTATATIVSQYLREQNIDPRPELATALVYALRTDMQAKQTTFCPADHHAFAWLMHSVDHQKLSDIENAPLSPAYYADLLLALQNTFTYEDTALCFLPRASGPEIIGEVADLLIRREDLRRVLCGAMVKGDVLLSVRTARGNGDASALLQQTLEGLGYGGGHRHRAGGKIDLSRKSDQFSEDLQSLLRSRWLAACGVDQQRGSRLVPRSEILENL